MSKLNLLLIILIILSACSKEEVEISNIKENKSRTRNNHSL